MMVMLSTDAGVRWLTHSTHIQTEVNKPANHLESVMLESVISFARECELAFLFPVIMLITNNITVTMISSQ